jgi:hypothetical protein
MTSVKSNNHLEKEMLRTILSFEEQFKWFNSFVDTFLHSEDDELYRENMELKRCHSINVAQHMTALSKSIFLSENQCCLAGVIGLFHDIGRFPQYSEYRTFSDKDSAYHGTLGIKVLRETGKIDEFSPAVSKIITASVHNHGLAKIEKNLKDPELLYAKMIRDADKMDIFRIVDAYYKKMLTGKRNISIELGLSIENKITPMILESFLNEKTIMKSDLKTLNDFKILQAAWIFDLNFEYTKKYVRESGFLKSIIDSITMKKERSLIQEKAENYLEECLCR